MSSPTVRRSFLTVVLLVAGIMWGSGSGLSAAHARGSALSSHVKVRGYITALSPRLLVRDKQGAVHTVVLTSSTTYWHLKQRLTRSALKSGLRVYVLGTANSDGSVTALRIHIYYPRTSHTTRHRRVKKR